MGDVIQAGIETVAHAAGPLSTAVALKMLGGKELIQKVLGPTADYIGNALAYGTEKGFENIKRIFVKAEKKLSSNASNAVPPKVLKSILSDGMFCDDELTAEYYAGILASSKSNNFRDDRGAYYLGILNRLSTYQIKFHYIAYSALKIASEEANKDGQHERSSFAPIAFNVSTAHTLMEFKCGENPDQIIIHSYYGLMANNLLGDFSWIGNADEINSRLQMGRFNKKPTMLLIPHTETDNFVFVKPSDLGAELFLWGNGKRDVLPDDCFAPSISFPQLLSISPDDLIWREQIDERSH